MDYMIEIDCFCLSGSDHIDWFPSCYRNQFCNIAPHQHARFYSIERWQEIKFQHGKTFTGINYCAADDVFSVTRQSFPKPGIHWSANDAQIHIKAIGINMPYRITTSILLSVWHQSSRQMRHSKTWSINILRGEVGPNYCSALAGFGGLC